MATSINQPGYNVQMSVEIVSGGVARSLPLSNSFNKIEAAFCSLLDMLPNDFPFPRVIKLTTANV